MIRKIIMGYVMVAISLVAQAENSINISMHATVDIGVGKRLGIITATETPYGVLFTPQLTGLDASMAVRGFHVHENPDCGNFGLAAGGHFDPQKTNKHRGPYVQQGHLGDIQVLVVNEDGMATLPVLAPRLTLKDIEGHALIIHRNGDNYQDSPNALGGGGARVACGIIPSISR